MIEVMLFLGAICYIALMFVLLILRIILFIVFELICLPFRFCGYCLRKNKCKPINPNRRYPR